MLKFMIPSLMLVLASAVQASDLNQVILVDGSVARCAHKEDVGNRIYRLKTTSISEDIASLEVESLVCVSTQSGFVLKDLVLTASETFSKKGSVLVYEYSAPALQITNTEGTRELARLELDGSLNVQSVDLDVRQIKSQTSKRKVDVTLQMIKTVKVNGQIIDQRIVSGGHYRLTIR